MVIAPIFWGMLYAFSPSEIMTTDCKNLFGSSFLPQGYQFWVSSLRWPDVLFFVVNLPTLWNILENTQKLIWQTLVKACLMYLSWRIFRKQHTFLCGNYAPETKLETSYVVSFCTVTISILSNVRQESSEPGGRLFH